MSSKPPIFYWKPGRCRSSRRLRGLRREGLEAWATMDAGANVHVICTPQAEAPVIAALTKLSGVSGVLLDGVGEGPRDEWSTSSDGRPLVF
jgi:diphosphomevalonate decarboxylase